MRLSLSTTLAGLAVLALGTDVSAQIADLQPGRNFPTAINAFGGGRSENIDLADIDHDGDYDVGISNGGDGSAQANVIYINNGGVQGGTIATFSNGTATRFAGFPNDTSRDIEFADFENDGDFDIYISNRGTTANGGETSRAYINQGGLQFGSIGFFDEGTNNFWGNLISVPTGDEIGTQNGAGPFRDYSCDCDFADFNDDGFIDLFHSSYGPNINGLRDSRLFMNDGTGVFDEHWPWVDPGADIRLHTLDIDPVDLDDDFDIDVFGSSRDSQARVYRNNLYGGTGAGRLFTDMTQTAILNTGAGLNGSNNYEAEFADHDGDGDFDIWMKNYDGGGGGNLDRILRNNGDFTFTKMTTWIKGDPNTDENEVDFLDFDSDGDLDAWVANFLGTNYLYAGSAAQGVTFGDGFYHRTGTSSSGSQYSHNELPQNGNSNQSLDGEAADMDNDGDPDLLLSNDLNQQNRYYQNTLGVPDTFAPTFHKITNQGNKSDGSDTVIHVALRDNAPYYIVGYYRVNLVYTVDGGQERKVRMFSQGTQQFRGVIPGGHNGMIAYRIEAEDDNGNASVSGTTTYNQTAGGQTLIESLSTGTGGTGGVPQLTIAGTLAPGSATHVKLEDAAPNALSVLFISAASTPVPFKMGTLYTFPINVLVNRTTKPGGFDTLNVPWPGAIPSGVPLYLQYATADAGAVLGSGVTLSNAVKATSP
ncbi:MAG: hypothetical protein DHS20C15_10190 [Planctomycetota bacterium]|nr:MAG: hypothetical protein DHS20C15_10190 [Planctomycetota bacterium]